MNLAYWLRKAPQPVAILADDKRIECSRNARGWKELEATIGSLEPSKLTALDGSGNVIRSVVLEGEDGKPAASPEMTDLQLFARLLSEGYEKGMRANQPIIDSAMQFVERQGTRLQKAEGEIERLRHHIYKLNLQLAEFSGGAASGGEEESLMGAIISGALSGGGAAGNLAALKPAAKK